MFKSVKQCSVQKEQGITVKTMYFENLTWLSGKNNV
jgi:hypothetical protein